MKKRSFVLIFTAALVCMTGCGVAVVGDKEANTVADIVYENSAGHECRVYVLEEEVYTPYLVISDDYGGNVLLLREHVTEETVVYKDTRLFNVAASYYPESDVDAYLTNVFLERFSDGLKDMMAESQVVVTAKDKITGENYKHHTEIIERKLFLLSAAELGVHNSMMTEEGEKLDYFADNESPGFQWLRSAHLWDDVHAWGIQPEGAFSAPVSREYALRPSFCLPTDTKIAESDTIVDGETVFVLSADIPGDGAVEKNENTAASI